MKGTITFVGFGLLASSMAAALKQAGHAVKIRAVSSPGTQRRALEMKLADEVFDYANLAQSLPGTDLLLLCGPISHIQETLESLRHMGSHLTGPMLVSDIGSTKGAICAQGIQLPAPFLFVGGHPMAGSEKRSLEHFDISLYENAYWILCPQVGQPAAHYGLLQELIDAVGAHSVELDATDHDRIMARLSHVPQLVSTALASGLSPKILAKNHQHLAGRGFRDMTRIAASPWPMWRDIIATNHKEILGGVQEMQASLAQIENFLTHLPESSPSLQGVFEKGNEVRTSLSSPGKGFTHSLHELFVQLPDKPGAIVSVVTPLANAGINILDIELAKVREGIGGSLLLGFKALSEATQAQELLEKIGLQTRLRS